MVDGNLVEFDDLLGPAKQRPVRKPISVHDKLERHVNGRRLDVRDQGDMPSMFVTDAHAGVTVAWLSQVFGMDPSTVKKRLADCPPMSRRKAGYVYALPQAAKYLVKPVFDVQTYLRGMKPSDLPPQLTKEYWDAALKRQLWEERAGDLWRTAKVLEVLSDTFLMMKSTIQLWTEDLERKTGLTAEQRTELVKRTDSLQNEIHQSLVEMKSTRRTTPMQEEIGIDDPFVQQESKEEDLVG